MKKSLLAISIMFVLSLTLTGCATKGDLEKVQAENQQLNMKADEALKESQDAKAAALKANDAAVRAEERAKLAEEKAQKSEAIFERSMRK